MFHETADAYFEKQQKIEALDPTEIGYWQKVSVIEANYKAKIARIIYLANHPENDNTV